MFEIRKAERKKAKVKIGIAGPSGSGKTYSALAMARGLAGGDLSKVVVIDTENGSAELYSHLGEYSVISMRPPYGPHNYIEAISAAHAGGFQVIIIDSASQEWEGEGGCLNLHEKLGGKYQDWARITPLHRSFIDCILQTPVDFIITLRKKQDYSMNQENGKTRVQKMGMKDIQREGFEYELTINFDLEITHLATASKDRTGLFMPVAPFMISDLTGSTIASWVALGAEPEPVKPTEFTEPENYVIQIGKTTKGKKLSEIDIGELERFCSLLKSEAYSKRQPVTKPGQEFIDHVAAYKNKLNKEGTPK